MDDAVEAGLVLEPSPPPPSSDLTEEFRQQERARGRASLFYFMTAICGLNYEDPDSGESEVCDAHVDLCSFLEGRPPHFPFSRAIICCFRGFGKSVAVMIYMLWRCLYIVNFSCIIVSNSDENAKKEHFMPLLLLLTTSSRAEYIRWLYSDRIPSGMAGSNSEQIVFVRTSPVAPPAIRYLGMEAKFEGKHVDLIVLDDPEGSDAEKTIANNELAFSAWQQVAFLLKHPVKSQVIGVATPWGKKPLVWKLRDDCGWKQQSDNETSPIKFFWRPIEDPNGNPTWPQRFTKDYINSVRINPLNRSQLWLERDSGTKSLFDMDRVIRSCYTWSGAMKDEICYQGFKFDPDKLNAEGQALPALVNAVVHKRRLRYFIHLDPLHKTEATRKRKTNILTYRPATAAIAVVGVAPDFHAFLVDYWVGDEDLRGQAEQLFRLYRLWAASLVTFEAVGAQIWLQSFIETQEASNPNWARPKSLGKLGQEISLPRLSRRLQEADKTNESKEWLYRERLSPWLSHGTLHLHLNDQDLVIKQLENVQNETFACDLVDCLAQGPTVWKPGAMDQAGRAFAERRAYVEGFVHKGGTLSRTGLRPPGWRA